MNRRRFLKGLSASSIFVPRILRSAPGLPFFTVPLATPLASVQNGLLNGLLGYWQMDQASGANAPDASGNGFTGTNTGTVTAAVGLIVNSAKIFGSGQGFSISSSIDTRASSTPFTIAMWFNDAGGGGGSGAMIGEWNTRNDYVIFNASGEVPTFRASDDSGTTSDVVGTAFACCAGTSPILANWTSLIFGFDGSHIFICQNNGTVSTTAKTAVRRGGGNFIIGNYQTFTLEWPGYYDEIGYWNRTFSAADRTNFHNNGNGLPFSSYTN